MSRIRAEGQAVYDGIKAARNSWYAMRQRCLSPRYPKYHRYGGRGITICQAWAASFDAFLRDMGPRPEGTSIDRIDNDGNYEPGNCRWATMAEQIMNRPLKKARHFPAGITHAGVTDTVAGWARRVGIPEQTLRHRISRSNIPAEIALTTPSGALRPKPRNAAKRDAEIARLRERIASLQRKLSQLENH